MQTTSIDLSASTSRKSRYGLAWFLLSRTAQSRLRWKTSHTATGTTFSCRIAKRRFDRPIFPMPMNAAAILSFAPRTGPVKRDVVSAAAPADFKNSLRSVILSPHNDIHQLIRHHNHLHHLLAIQQRRNLSIPNGMLLQRLARRSKRHENPAAHFAVHLNHDLRLFLARQFRIVHRPGLMKQRSLPSLLFPQL